MTSRRDALSYLRLPALAGFAAGLPGLAHAQAKQMVLGTWGGDYGDLLRRFVDEPLARSSGIQVVQQAGSDKDRYTKMVAERQARRGSFDVVAQTDSDAYTLGSMGVFQEVPVDKVPRISAVIPALRKATTVPHIYSAMVVLYNSNKVTAAPTSYADLWDPKFKGRVGLTDALFVQNMSMASVAGSGKPNNLESAKKMMMGLREMDAKLYPSNEALAAGLKAEEVWLTPMWIARGFMWRKAGIPLAQAVPREGALSIVFELGVPRNSRNHDLAWAYLDRALQAEAQTEFAAKMGYLPTVTDTKLAPEIAKAIDLTDAQRAKLITPDYAFLQQNAPAIQEFWDKQFKG